MIFEEKVNGIPVRAEYRDETVERVFIPLLRFWTAEAKKKKGRYIVFLAAPPAAGKSTLALFLEALSRRTEGVLSLTALGMDGFHKYRSALSEETALWFGETVTLAEIKGAPQTFDLPKFTEALKALASGALERWPLYDRTIHDPVEDAIGIEERLILVEGNYLLLDRPGWRELQAYADDTVFIRASEPDLRDRLIARKIAGGKTRTEAEAFVDYTDLRNVRTVLAHSLPAAHEIELLSGI